ncbi:YggS family pyridoxal phosphate-dependent enzyme [Amnibacterium endophyticum]|uniref:Pyridoxal phosphate homeostasis protein n=1 Tax=Amnibacterium endophyticum TaxID=2109337 RepID=A0ABW4LH75_9MICO
MPERLESRLAEVRERVAAAARGAGRAPDDVTLIVVTKFQPVDLVQRLRALGVADFGENRHPEARDKAAAVPDAAWHFIGQLQTNKARQVARYVDALHSVDRADLVHALRDADLDVLLQVDLDGDTPGRGGAAPPELGPLAEAVLATGHLRLRGVMAVAPRDEEPARAFARLEAASDQVRRVAPDASWISAGMSGDYEAAIAAGATHVRVGAAITGPRSTPG